jgi:ORF6N domain
MPFQLTANARFRGNVLFDRLANQSSAARNILVIRGDRVLVDSELAALYEVETKALTRAVRRNADRFPVDFMFQLTAEEGASLRSQIGTLKSGRGRHRKYASYVFTEPTNRLHRAARRLKTPKRIRAVSPPRATPATKCSPTMNSRTTA